MANAGDITKLTMGTDEYTIKDSGAKRTQSAVTGPSSTTGTTTTFVDSITQNANGEISYTTKQISAEIPGTAEYAEALTPGSKIDGVDFDGSANIIHYGVCSSSSGSNASVICPGFGATLAAGARIIVKFQNAWVAPSSIAKMNIVSSSSDTTGTGLKDIKYRGGVVAGFAAGQVVEFVYDGTNWERVGDVNTDTTYTFDGTYNASSNKAATVSTVTNAINALDYSEVVVSADQHISKISETNGKIAVTTADIAITPDQVTHETATNMAAYFNGDGELAAHSTVSATELGYLDGVTSNIQTQINNISGGGTDHIRFYKNALSFTVAVNVSTSNVIGGYTVSQGDILIGTDGQIGKVGAISSGNALLTKVGELIVKHAYSSGNLTIGPVNVVAS
jgi:hypothetical protein